VSGDAKNGVDGKNGSGPAIQPIAIQIICNPANIAEMQINHPQDRLASIQVLAHAIRVLAGHVAQHGNKDASPVKVATAAQMPPAAEPGANRLKLYEK
jgi:hypothetical protein